MTIVPAIEEGPGQAGTVAHQIHARWHHFYCLRRHLWHRRFVSIIPMLILQEERPYWYGSCTASLRHHHRSAQCGGRGADHCHRHPPSGTGHGQYREPAASAGGGAGVDLGMERWRK